MSILVVLFTLAVLDSPTCEVTTCFLFDFGGAEVECKCCDTKEEEVICHALMNSKKIVPPVKTKDTAITGDT